MESCKAKLLRLSENLSDVWDRTECVLLTVHCDRCPEKETLQKFLSVIFNIGRRVIRPVLEELLYFAMEDVKLTPRRPDQWPFRIEAFVTRGGVNFEGRYWDDENLDWMNENVLPEVDLFSSL